MSVARGGIYTALVTDLLGFGVTLNPDGSVASVDGPTIGVTDAIPTGLVSANPGSLLLGRGAAAGLWVNRSGGAGWAHQAPTGIAAGGLTLLVDPVNPGAVDDTDPSTPFRTIQAAITATGAPADLTDQKRRFTILLAPGQYDENISNAGVVGRRITLYPLGPVTLGDGAVDADFTSTTPRNITWDCTPAFGGRGVFAIGTYNPSILYGGRCTQAGAFDVSGNIVLTGTPTAAAATAIRLNMCRIRGNIDGTALAALGVDMHHNELRIDGTVTGTNIVLINSHFTAYLGAVTVLFMVTCLSCQFEGGITVSQVPTFGGQDTLPPGFYGCRFQGAGPPAFTGPANSLVLDGTSNYWFKAGGWTLAGGATKVITTDLVA